MIPRSEISAFDTLVSAIWRAHVLPAKNSRPRRYSCALQRVATRNGLWQHWQRWRENPRHCTGLISGRDFNGIAVFYPEKSRLQGTNKDVCIRMYICNYMYTCIIYNYVIYICVRIMLHESRGIDRSSHVKTCDPLWKSTVGTGIIWESTRTCDFG